MPEVTQSRRRSACVPQLPEVAGGEAPGLGPHDLTGVTWPLHEGDAWPGLTAGSGRPSPSPPHPWDTVRPPVTERAVTDAVLSLGRGPSDSMLCAPRRVFLMALSCSLQIQGIVCKWNKRHIFVFVARRPGTYYKNELGENNPAFDSHRGRLVRNNSRCRRQWVQRFSSEGK